MKNIGNDKISTTPRLSLLCLSICLAVFDLGPKPANQKTEIAAVKCDIMDVRKRNAAMSAELKAGGRRTLYGWCHFTSLCRKK